MKKFLKKRQTIFVKNIYIKLEVLTYNMTDVVYETDFRITSSTTNRNIFS